MSEIPEDMSGTELFEQTLAFDYEDAERSDLMRKVWSVTPYMIDYQTGSPGADTYRNIVTWCRDNFGPQAHPIHEFEGDWQLGSATIFGWTWIGFKTQEQLDTFISGFSAPSPKQGPTE